MATLEEIQLKVDEVKSKIPGIKQGIEALSASDLSEGAGAIEPVVPTTTTPGAGAAITNVTGIQQMLGTMMAQRDKEIADIKEQQVEKQSMWQKMLGDKKSSAEILKEQYTAVEESPAYKEVQRISAQMEPLNLQIADLTNQETAEIERNELRLASGIAKDMAETAIHNKYNRLKAPIATQMNAYAANAMLYEGQLDKAYQYADAAVRASVYDQEFQYNTMRDFMESNDDFLNSLQKTDRDYFDNALNLSAQAYSEAKADREYVMDLQMQSGGQANITINDTRQEAQGKYADWLGQQTGEVDLLSVSEAKSLGVPYGTTRQDAMGLTPEGTTDIISQATLNKMGAAGVPNDVALTMQQDVNSGVSWDDIYNGMSATYGNVKAGQYIDKFRKIMAEQGTIQVPSLPPESYEERAEAEATTPEKEKKPGIIEKITDWWHSVQGF